MARNQEVVPVGSGWTELTNGDVSLLSFQVNSGEIILQATTGAAPAATSSDGRRYTAPYGENFIAIATLASSIAATRVFAKATTGVASVMVDHA